MVSVLGHPRDLRRGCGFLEGFDPSRKGFDSFADSVLGENTHSRKIRVLALCQLISGDFLAVRSESPRLGLSAASLISCGTALIGTVN